VYKKVSNVRDLYINFHNIGPHDKIPVMAKSQPIENQIYYHPIQKYTFSYCADCILGYLKVSGQTAVPVLKKTVVTARQHLRINPAQANWQTIYRQLGKLAAGLYLRSLATKQIGMDMISERRRQLKKKVKRWHKSIKITHQQGVIFAGSQAKSWQSVYHQIFFPPKKIRRRAKKRSQSKSQDRFDRRLARIKKQLLANYRHKRDQLRTGLARWIEVSKQEWQSIVTPQKKTARPARHLIWQKRLLRSLRKGWWSFTAVISHYRFKLAISLLITVLMFAGSYLIYDAIFRDLPTAQDLLEKKPQVSTKITDRHNTLLYSIYRDENRTVVPLSLIPNHLAQATVAIEDQNFYYHHGFDLQGIARAILANFKGEEVQGGSTITQQLVKNTLLNNEKTFRRKIREVLVAITVDASFSKDKILEMYLNQVAYGGSTYGVEAAAERYFGKPVAQLNLAESAFLAGLPQAPTTYSPFGPYPERAYTRQAEVLKRMVEENYITAQESQAALDTPLKFRKDIVDIEAPHFVMYVKEILAEKYGEELIYEGGLQVKTTLDLSLQMASQEIVTNEVTSLARLRVNNGAALITNPKTGEILAMVGSKDYFDFEHDGQVNVTLRPRQPGSSIKPVTYSLAFERGKTPATVIDDSPITYPNLGSKPYTPKNYDGKFHGRVTLRQALGSSYNVPAVKLLAELGISNMIDQAQDLGITTWGDRARFGLSLTLGGGEVRMIDMNKVYGTFANFGQTVDINPILEISTFDGQVLYRNTCALDGKGCPGHQSLSSQVAAQITDVLSDNAARTPAFGPRSILNIPNQQVAVKTGTTNNLRDNWTIGYTTDRVISVWVGNNDNQPMSYIASGITGASPIWNSLIKLVLSDERPHRFATPEGMIKVKICAQTGTLPCSGCPTVREELFVPGTEPQQACSPSFFKPKTADPNLTDPDRDRILDGIMFE